MSLGDDPRNKKYALLLTGLFDAAVFLVALTAIGAGVSMKDPAWAMVVVGGILLGLVLVSRLRGGKPE